MKNFLLLCIAALTISSAYAQFNMSTVDPASRIASPREMKLDAPTSSENKAPKKAKSNYAYYNRPAGAFVGNTIIKNGDYSAFFNSPIMIIKPFSEYTFSGVKNNMDDSWWLSWSYFDQNTQQWSDLEHSDNLTINSGYNTSHMPYLYVFNQNDEHCSTYQLGSYDYYTGHFYEGEMYPIYDFAQYFGSDLLLSSKTMIPGGRFGDLEYGYMTPIMGATPYGNNSIGWWLGKNGEGVDGIAQAFEKPEHPYILKQVVLEASHLQVSEEVEMTCKIYKLADGIPAYKDNGYVELQSIPGELIATGRATLAPQAASSDGKIIVFSLYGNNGKEITPKIKDAIFIAIDGYNAPEMENLVDFTALNSMDTDADEGFGELAYVKEFVDGEYIWHGLNNYFSHGTLPLKTGLSIYITTKFSYEEMEQTEEPVINYDPETFTVTVEGNGEIHVYVDGNEVQVPYTFEQTEEEVTYVVTATAQEDGKEISETATRVITVPAKADTPEPEDPHATGFWLVAIDKDGNEVWEPMAIGDDEDGHQTSIAFTYKDYGTFDWQEGDNEEARPNVPFYVVIDGVAYGPNADATVPVYGDANENPLFENENMWGVPLGYKYVIGVVKDVIDGNYYLQISRGGFVGLDELNAGKTVANVRYFNMAGQEMQQADGICIIVTIFTDGSTSAVKVMK